MMEIVKESHVDHGFTKAQKDWLVQVFADRNAFFIETVTLPEELGTVPCALRGPVMGDDAVPEREAIYHNRGDRSYPSRMCLGASRPTRTVTVIAGPDGLDACVLYTAFGGPLAPKEPNDPTVKPEEMAGSVAFWAEHALATIWG